MMSELQDILKTHKFSGDVSMISGFGKWNSFGGWTDIITSYICWECGFTIGTCNGLIIGCHNIYTCEEYIMKEALE